MHRRVKKDAEADVYINALVKLIILRKTLHLSIFSYRGIRTDKFLVLFRHRIKIFNVDWDTSYLQLFFPDIKFHE